MRELHLTPQARRVLKHLEKHRTITPLEAIGVYSIFRLASCIHEIRREGFNVKTKLRRDDSKKTYAQYELERATA